MVASRSAHRCWSRRFSRSVAMARSAPCTRTSVRRIRARGRAGQWSQRSARHHKGPPGLNESAAARAAALSWASVCVRTGAPAAQLTAVITGRISETTSRSWGGWPLIGVTASALHLTRCSCGSHRDGHGRRDLYSVGPCGLAGIAASVRYTAPPVRGADRAGGSAAARCVGGVGRPTRCRRPTTDTDEYSIVRSGASCPNMIAFQVVLVSTHVLPAVSGTGPWSAPLRCSTVLSPPN